MIGALQILIVYYSLAYGLTNKNRVVSAYVFRADDETKLVVDAINGTIL